MSQVVREGYHRGGTGSRKGLSEPVVLDYTVSPLSRLSPREREVMSLLAQGAATSVVARDLCIEIDTAKNHITHIYDKLGVSNRAEAIQLATTGRLDIPD